jgi:hypothetical protein
LDPGLSDEDDAVGRQLESAAMQVLTFGINGGLRGRREGASIESVEGEWEGGEEREEERKNVRESGCLRRSGRVCARSLGLARARHGRRRR